jgi:hypothetical protein
MIPGITFCVMTKSHHTRFFQNDQRFQDRSKNPVAGMLVG